jgi:hypothetical protein
LECIGVGVDCGLLETAIFKRFRVMAQGNAAWIAIEFVVSWFVSA